MKTDIFRLSVKANAEALAKAITEEHPNVVVFNQYRALERRFRKWCSQTGIDAYKTSYTEKEQGG